MLLDRSQLQRIEAGTFNQTPLLQTLDLSGNKFVSPPCDAFGPDNLLTEFYLNDNLISSIPENCFANLTNLQRITLNDNPIGNVPMSALAGLTSLKTIELANASLSTVPVGALSPVRKVTHLKMARNLITALEERDFSVLPEAEYVDLSYNRIRFVHEHAFANMLRLKVLILSSNKIAIIGWRAFIPVESTLEELHLHENQLQSIGNISASTILSLQTFLLADNPLQCHCHLSEYRFFLQTQQHLLQVQGGHGKCIEPGSEIEVSVLESSLTETACPLVSTSARPSVSDPLYAQVPAVPIVPAAITKPAQEGTHWTKDRTFIALITVATVTVTLLIVSIAVLVFCRAVDKRTSPTKKHWENNNDGIYEVCVPKPDA
ncbi:uncharacterized protein [Diadema antillarum]|uniref:uncharacterized protein n=1 Tax=Diadema antillarum TaxID=105358 RepID=UPI003A835BF0